MILENFAYVSEDNWLNSHRYNISIKTIIRKKSSHSNKWASKKIFKDSWREMKMSTKAVKTIRIKQKLLIDTYGWFSL